MDEGNKTLPNLVFNNIAIHIWLCTNLSETIQAGGCVTRRTMCNPTLCPMYRLRDPL